jgi:NAD(P)-dependent dehydrogenase (short-subunit alcohol dehydrogenase family)
MGLEGLAGKVAVVTGGASGIGAAAAKRLSREGASVAVVDLDREAAEQVADSLGGPALAVAADVSRGDDVDRYMHAAVERSGRVDLHHVNAGIAGALAPIPDLSAEEFDEVIAVNLRGVFSGAARGVSAVPTARRWRRNRHHSLHRRSPRKRRSRALSRREARSDRPHALRRVYGGPLGVRVNAIAPGIIPTGLLSQSATQGTASSGAAARASITPLGRVGTVEEVAALAAFLLSDEAEYLTGEVLAIDGGAIATNPLRPSRATVPPTEGVTR